MAEGMTDRLKTIVACNPVAEIQKDQVSQDNIGIYLQYIYRYELVCYTNTKKTS